MLKVSLKVVGGKHDGTLVPLASPKFLIGRENDCHLRPNSDMVSRHHCAFAVDDYAVRLRDLGSTNGTLVNGERIRGVVQLNAGDEVTVGKLQFRIEIGEAAVPQPGAGRDESGLQGETAQLSGEDTHYEMPTFKFEAEPGQATDDATTVTSAAELESPTPLPPTQTPNPQQQQAPQPQMQPGYQYPGQYPPPGYPYGMGFPGPMPGYFPPYPQYPQYPYPQPVMMGYPQYQQQAPEPTNQTAVAEESSEPEVRLPDPGSTGVQTPQAAVAANGSGKAAEKNPSQHAADIIRQHLHRRPDVEEK